MGLVDFSTGLQGALLQRMILQREAQKYADAQRQQGFQNSMASRREGALEDQNAYSQKRQAGLDAQAANDRMVTQANTIGDQIAPGTLIEDSDPAVKILQGGGRGSLLTKQESRPAVIEGPLLPGDTGGALKGGFLKTASQKQIDTNTDNARQADTVKEQQKRDAEIARHNGEMEKAALNKPDHAGDTRMDRSYQYHRSSLDKIAKPLEDQQQRMGRLIESVNQGTPQADALVAPELLTVMAGGAGSGLRINEAEISRLIGGRSKWESLKASMNQWATDPSKANSITPDQRQQMRTLIKAVHDKSQQALGVVNDAGDQLVDAPDVLSHRRVLTDARKKLQAIYEPPADASSGQAPSGSGGGVSMVAPDGRRLTVPADKVAELEAHGAKRTP